MSDYNEEKNTAIRAVVEASKLCSSVRSTFISNERLEKKDRTPVTVADYGSQVLITRAIRSAFPGDKIVAEEDSSDISQQKNSGLKDKVLERLKDFPPVPDDNELYEYLDMGGFDGGTKERFWTIDPIDGTKGFLRGGQYAIALALVENGEVVLGVLGCPELNSQIFYAVRGQGAYVRPAGDSSSDKPVNVSTEKGASKIRFCESYESSHTSHSSHKQIAENLGIETEPIRIDSQCKYVIVASGEAEVYLRFPSSDKNYRQKIWDHAAGVIITEEAGGRVSDIHGRTLDFSLGRELTDNRGVLVTNGYLHDDVLASIKNIT